MSSGIPSSAKHFILLAVNTQIPLNTFLQHVLIQKLKLLITTITAAVTITTTTTTTAAAATTANAVFAVDNDI